MAVADLEKLAGPRLALGFGAGWSSIAAHGPVNPRPIRKAGRERCLTVWTPEQVQGDNGG